MFKVVRVRQGRQSCSMGWEDVTGVCHVDRDVTGCRGISHVQGDGRGCMGVSHVQADGRG